MNLKTPQPIKWPPKFISQRPKSPPNMSRASRSPDSVSQNQRELEALLRRIRSKPEVAKVPGPVPRAVPLSPSIAEEARVPPATRRTAPKSLATDGAYPVEAGVRKVMTPIAAVSLAASAIALLTLALHLGALGRVGEVSTRVDRLEAAAKGLDQLVKQRLTSQDGRISEMGRDLDEARFPSAGFKNAQDLMQAGRYLEAEEVYGALLASRPTSSLTPIVAGNSAVANAILGGCQMMNARLSLLRSVRPADTLLARSGELAIECERHRRAKQERNP